MDLLLLCFGFFNLSTFGIFSLNTTKETEFPNSLRAFDHLPLSLSLHYHGETFHIGRGDTGNGSGVSCTKERHCGDPGKLMITVRWMSTDTHIISNKHLRIPKSGAASIG
jgi:hypothetical protein